MPAISGLTATERPTEVTLRIADGYFTLSDLGEFCTLLSEGADRSAGAYLKSSTTSPPETDIVSSIFGLNFPKEAEQQNWLTSPDELGPLFLKQISFSKDRSQLRIVRIRYESPLEIVIAAVTPALAMALIISGGKIQVEGKRLSCQLPPLGEGIAKLRKAFKRSPRKRGQ